MSPPYAAPAGRSPLEVHCSTAIDPTKRGEEFGRSCAALVGNTVVAYRELFVAEGLSADSVERVGTDVERWLDANHPDLAREVRGIARGAGVSTTQLMAINARTELRSASPPECSTVAIVPLSDSPHSLLAQNWDYHPSLAGSRVVWHVQHGDGWFVTFTEAGIVGKIGLNQSGLAICLNGLRTDRDGVGVGAPIHVLLRILLESCTTLPEAEHVLASVPFSASAAVTIMHADGSDVHTLAFELTPAGLTAIAPRDGYLVHTNHFLSRPRGGVDQVAARWPDTAQRLRELQATLAAIEGPLTHDTIRMMLSSHRGGERGVCTHAENEPAFPNRSETLASVLIDPLERRFYVTDGPPCRSDYADLTDPC